MPSKTSSTMELDFLECVNNIFYVHRIAAVDDSVPGKGQITNVTPLKGIYAKRRILRS